MTATTMTTTTGIERTVSVGRTEVLTQTVLLTGRQLRAFARQPAYLVMNVMMPLVWLLLFGQLFEAIVDIPGFGGGDDYIAYLTPGLVMMMALSASAWAGTTFVDDMNLGVMDRFLTSPTRRGALVVATMLYQGVLTVLQTLVVVGVAWATGARFHGGVTGILVLFTSAVLLTLAFAALSNAVALLARAQTALIGISQLLSLPLMFLSSAIMDTDLAPGWIRAVSRVNPVEWAVVAGRGALSGTPDWADVVGHLGLLAGLTLAMAWLATLAFRSYQRSA